MRMNTQQMQFTTKGHWAFICNKKRQDYVYGKVEYGSTWKK